MATFALLFSLSIGTLIIVGDELPRLGGGVLVGLLVVCLYGGVLGGDALVAYRSARLIERSVRLQPIVSQRRAVLPPSAVFTLEAD